MQPSPAKRVIVKWGALRFAGQDAQLVRSDVRELEARTDGRFRLVYWMLGFNLVLTLFTFSLTAGILLKLLAG